MQSMAPSSVSGTHTTTCMRTLHQTRAAGLHPFHPRAACKRYADLRRALSSSSTLRNLCWTCCLHSKTVCSGGHEACQPSDSGPSAWQTAERTAEASTTEGSMGSILAGVGVGVRKRSGLTGAPAVNFLSGFSAARRSIVSASNTVAIKIIAGTL